MFKLLFLLFLIGCSTGNVIVEVVEREGPYNVTNIVDGDTLDLNDSRRVRLSGINTPETGECYYKEAKDKLKGLILGKEVYLEEDKSDKDKYGRYLRYVYINSIMVNSILVREGYAKVYDKYKEDTGKYYELKEEENKAKVNLLGVWVCEDTKQGCLYVGSKNSNKYYKPDCKWAKRIKPENLNCYNSEEEVKDLVEGKGC